MKTKERWNVAISFPFLNTTKIFFFKEYTLSHKKRTHPKNKGRRNDLWLPWDYSCPYLWKWNWPRIPTAGLWNPAKSTVDLDPSHASPGQLPANHDSMSMPGKLRQVHSQGPTASFDSSTLVSLVELSALWSRTFRHSIPLFSPSFSFQSDAFQVFSGSLPPPIFSHPGSFPNKILVHLISSWYLPLGGPELMHNCRWKILTNIWKLCGWRSSS